MEIEQRKGIFRTAIEYFRNFAKLFGDDDINTMEDNIDDIAQVSGYDPKEIEALKASIKSVDSKAAITTYADIRVDDDDVEEITNRKKTPFWKKTEESKAEKVNDENSSQAEYGEDAQALLNRVKKPRTKGEERE